MRSVLIPRVSIAVRRVAALDLAVWSALIGLAFAGFMLTEIQNIRARPDPMLVSSGVGLLFASLVVRYMLPDDDSPGLALEGFAAFLTSAAIMAPLSYVVTRSPFPPVDAVFNSLERGIGFSAALARYDVFHNSALRWVLESAYLSFIPQYITALFLLPRTVGKRRGLELIRLSILTLLISYVIAFRWPAIGSMPEIEVSATAWHALHDSWGLFDSGGQIQPMISLPSYHAAMAVMLAYSMRELGPLSWVVVVLDALMMAATPVIGCHHLIDIPAGAAVAGLSILLVRQLGHKVQPTRLAVWKSKSSQAVTVVTGNT